VMTEALTSSRPQTASRPRRNAPGRSIHPPRSPSPPASVAGRKQIPLPDKLSPISLPRGIPLQLGLAPTGGLTRYHSDAARAARRAATPEEEKASEET
jgi:hypothetical protein